jgi:hypothetical protein
LREPEAFFVLLFFEALLFFGDVLRFALLFFVPLLFLDPPVLARLVDDFFVLDFFDDDFFDEDFFDEDFFAAGTLPPSARASDSPMAMACLRLVTFLPEPPLRSVPAFRSCIVFSTFSLAFFPYLLAM